MREKPAKNTINSVSYMAAARIGCSDVTQQVMFRKDWRDIFFFRVSRGFHFSVISLSGVLNQRHNLIASYIHSQNTDKQHRQEHQGSSHPRTENICSSATVGSLMHSIVVLLYL